MAVNVRSWKSLAAVIWRDRQVGRRQLSASIANGQSRPLSIPQKFVVSRRASKVGLARAVFFVVIVSPSCLDTVRLALDKPAFFCKGKSV